MAKHTRRKGTGFFSSENVLKGLGVIIPFRYDCYILDLRSEGGGGGRGKSVKLPPPPLNCELCNPDRHTIFRPIR